PRFTLFPYTTLFRSAHLMLAFAAERAVERVLRITAAVADLAHRPVLSRTSARSAECHNPIYRGKPPWPVSWLPATHSARNTNQKDRKSTRLNSSHVK